MPEAASFISMSLIICLEVGFVRMGERIRLHKNDRCYRIDNFLKIIKEAVVCQGAFRFRCQVSVK